MTTRQSKILGWLQMPPDTCVPLLMIQYAYNTFCILIGWGHINLFQTVQNFEIQNDWYFLKSSRANVMKINLHKVIVSEACELSRIKKEKKTVWQQILYASYYSGRMVAPSQNADFFFVFFVFFRQRLTFHWFAAPSWHLRILGMFWIFLTHCLMADCRPSLFSIE